MSAIKAYLVLYDRNALAMAFSENVVQQGCLTRPQKASDDLQSTHYMFDIAVNKLVTDFGASAKFLPRLTVTGIRISTTVPSISTISASATLAGAGAGAGFGLCFCFLTRLAGFCLVALA